MPSFLKKNKNFIVLISLIFLQLILISIQVPMDEEETYFEKLIFSLFSPVQHGVVYIFQKTGSFWRSYLSLRGVRNENERLKEEIFFLLQENNIIRNILEKYKNENEIQDALRNIKENILHARVIGFDASNFYKSAVINKGSLDKIQENMSVLDRYGNLVGRIVGPISLKESRVQLVTDIDCGISVFSEKKEMIGVLTGDGKGRCLLKYILSTDKDFFEGERVYTSGFDGIFPPGIGVGEIVSLKTTPGLFKKIIVKPYFKFQDMDHLAVININNLDIF